LLIAIQTIGGPEGLRSLTNLKVVVVDKYPWLIETSIPVALDYPVRSLVQSWYVLAPLLQYGWSLISGSSDKREFVSGLVGFLYGYRWKTRLQGLARLIRAT
jgi:hypothetical protein